MTLNSDAFDHWIRTSFQKKNTELEELYFAQTERANIDGIGDGIKNAIRDEGHAFIVKLFDEGNTDEGFDHAFNVLGNLGLYLASLRRHELTNPDRETVSPFGEASALGLHIAASLGVAPRFATSHLSTHNNAISGKYKSFTSLKDELLFLEYNTRGVLCYKRVADALDRVWALGVTHPVSEMLFEDAINALQDVIIYNKKLFDELDIGRFFYCVRPYYKPYRVGRDIYRGANAGDFSGINEIDLILGLCRANDPYYSQLLVEKMLFMMPQDQLRLRDCLRRKSFLDEFLEIVNSGESPGNFKTNLGLFLKVCDLHGKAASQHHNMLVERFIKMPSSGLAPEHKKQITASGPPLDELLKSLQTLRDLRTAAPRDDIRTRHNDLEQLKNTI